MANEIVTASSGQSGAVSEFLRGKMAQEKASGQQTGGVSAFLRSKVEQEQTAQQAQTSAASEFLRKKADEEAIHNASRYGTSEALDELLAQVQGLQLPKAGEDGSYYSFSTPGRALDDAGEKLEYMPSVLRSYEIPMEQADAELTKVSSQLQVIGKYLNQAKDAYNTMPSAVNAEAYNTILKRYQETAEQYDALYKSYSDASSAYQGAFEKIKAISSAYDSFITGQQAAFTDWKSRIRDADSIQAEMAAVEQQMEQVRQKANDERAWYEVLGDNWIASRNMGINRQREEEIRNLPEMQKLRQKQALLQEELEWSNYYKYADLMQAADFGEKSKYVSTYQPGTEKFNAFSGTYTNSGFGDINYDYINKNETAQNRQSLSDIQSNASFLGLDNSQRLEMTDDEIAIFNYLYALDTEAGDTEHSRAYEYIRTLNGSLNQRQRQAQEEQWKAWANEHPINSSLFSVAMAPMKGLSYLGQAADYFSDGKIDQNAAYNKFSYIPGTIRGEVSRKIQESGKWGGVGSFAYQRGLSMADFLLASAVTGGNSSLALAIMGTGAAADATLEAKDRGLSDGQAFALGTIAGAAEVITEKFSLDTLLNPKLLKSGAGKYILKNMLAEGSEEVGSDLINTIADILIAQDKSQWEQSIQAYMDAGKSEGTAFGLALRDKALEMGLDFLGGAISGGIMSGVGSLGYINYTNALNKKVKSGNLTVSDMQALVQEGLASDPNTDSHQLALELQEKLKAGKELTSREIARLMTANQAAIEQEQRNNPGDSDGLEDRTDAQDDADAGFGYDEDVDFRETVSDLPQSEPVTFQEAVQRQVKENMGAENPAVRGTATLADPMVQVQDWQLEQAQRLASLTGRRVKLFDGEQNVNGFYDGSTGEIWLNVKGGNLMTQAFSHELTHSIEQAGAYEKLSMLVLNRMQSSGIDLDNAREVKRKQYASQGKALQNEKAVDQELVAEYVSKHLLTDEASIRALVEKDWSLGETILGILDRLLAKLGNKNAQERVFLSRARSLYAKALRQTRPGAAAKKTARANASAQTEAKADGSITLEELDAQLAAGEITDEDYDNIRSELESRQEEQYVAGERQYSVGKTTNQYDYSKPFAKQLADYLDGKIPKGDTLIVGATPDVFQRIGMAALPITINSTHIDYALNGTKDFDHYIGKSLLEQLPEAIKSPIAVMTSDTRSNSSVVAMLEIRHNGKQIVVPVVVNGYGKQNGIMIDSNAITSIYGKNSSIKKVLHDAIVQEASGKFRLYYLDKNKATALLQKARVPMPKNSALHNGGFIHSLSDPDSPVKSRFSNVTQSQQFKRWFGDWQNHPESSSKIVNADGTPKVVYHGTNGHFDVFQSESGAYWFSESEDYAESMMEERGGGEVKPVYLNIRNPDHATLDPGQFSDPVYEAPIIRKAKAEGYDGVIIENSSKDPLVTDTFYVVFDNKQIKSANNNLGTFDGSNPDIRYSLADTAEDASEDAKAGDGRQEDTDLRNTMPKKAKGILDTAERIFMETAISSLHVPNLVADAYLMPVVQELSDTYLKNGTLTDEDIGLLFDKAYTSGVAACKDYLDRYSEVAQRLRFISLTPTEAEWNSIFDRKGFKEFAQGKIRIVPEGGMTVAEAFRLMQDISPDLFPESMKTAKGKAYRLVYAVHNAMLASNRMEQLKRGSEESMRDSEKADFRAGVSEIIGELWKVRRYGLEAITKQTDEPPATKAEIDEAFDNLKKARRNYERVSAKHLLTERDKMQVRRLLNHEIAPEHLQEGEDNVQGILAVYEAKQEYDRYTKLIGEYKRFLQGRRRKKADALLKTAINWKDKRIGLAYSRETMERNIYDIVPDRALASQIISQYFAPVHKAEAEATRFKTKYRNRVRELGLSTKVAKGNLVSEAHAVQLLGEAEDNIRMLEDTKGRIKNRDGKTLDEWKAVVQTLWAENPALDKGKLENAVKAFRKLYDELFVRMNEVRVDNGYEPVNYRHGYFPHFQPGDSDSLLSRFGRALGIDTRIDALPTTINGLTHTFKPGIQWFGNAQSRLGFQTAYDAVKGFDMYIEGVASVIHQTENIQNLRALESQIRYRASDEGIRKQVDEINARTDLSEEDKRLRIQEVYANGRCSLSNFVTELNEYTNLLANKKSRYDRAIEAAIGRRVYSFLKAWESRVAANMIAGNLTSALTNFIPLTQAGAQIGYRNLLTGMWQTLQAYRSDDGIVGMSTFLTNRRGSDPLVKSWSETASGWLGKPMEWIDGFVSEAIVRGSYYQNLRQGMTEADAMDMADSFAAGVMADRSKGSMPTLFHSTNPLMKAFTQFQLEVNNQFSEIFKDIPRRFREKGLLALTLVLIKYFLGAAVYNWLYKKLIGRKPAIDPIGMLCEFADDWKEGGLADAGKNLAQNALEQLPFSSGLTLIGVELDGGRIPASSAVPDFKALWDAAAKEGWSAEKRWKEVQDELNKLAYVVPPFGGNQVSKIWKGVKAYIQGGSYSVEDVEVKNEDGEVIGVEGMPTLQYPVYKDNPKDAFWNLVQAMFLGKNALGTAQDWVNSGFDSLNAKQTAAYQDMLAAGVKDRDAYGLLTDIRSAKETESKKVDAVRRNILRASSVSGDGKAIVYYGLMASDKERELMDKLSDMDADAGSVTAALMDMRDAGDKVNARLGVISKASLTDEEKAVLVGSVIGTDMLTEEGGLTQYAKFSYAVQNGMSVDQYIQYRSSGAKIDDYLKLRDAGASIEDAMGAGIALQELRNSVESPTTVQKWRVVIDSTGDPEKQFISLSLVMTDSQYAKLRVAKGFGVSPANYVSVNEQMAKFDKDGNGRLTQAEVTNGIGRLKLTNLQKAVLWQLVTGSSSAKNNPYSQSVGQKVIDAVKEAKEAAENKEPSFREEIMRQIKESMGK